MEKHEIVIVNRQRKAGVSKELKELVSSCVSAVLAEEGFPHRAAVTVTLVSNRAIRTANRDFRGVDKPTDVLSFPLLAFDEKGRMMADAGDWDKESEALMLGDILLSLEQAEIQARQYGHSLMREAGYLTVHSVYHLLGFDHMSEKDKKIMRKKEERVLLKLNLPR